MNIDHRSIEIKINIEREKKNFFFFETKHNLLHVDSMIQMRRKTREEKGTRYENKQKKIVRSSRGSNSINVNS